MMMMMGERWDLGIGEDLLIKESCSLAMKASSGDSSPPFLLHHNRCYDSVAIFAFPGSWTLEEWRGSPSKVDSNLFPSLRGLGSNESALVHGGFLHRFHTLLMNSAFEHQVHRAVSERKQIVFTGHSAGGAIATLATVWLLEQFRKPDDCKRNLPLCMTFGSPLIGDSIFGRAISRENWSHCFLNFVMRYDIVPRISLSPIKSIDQDFQSILVFLNPKSSYSTLDTIGKSQQAISLFTTVMRNVSSVANLRACVDMGCTNMLLQEIPGFIQLCPYRPFGTYMFSTGNGRLVGVNNSDAVLHLLFFSLQLGPEQELAEVAYRSIKEHLAYGSEVKECLVMQDVVFLDRLEEIPLSSDDGFCNGMQSINMALRDLGLSMEARLCLRAARESKLQAFRNKAKLEANYSKIQEALKSLHRYREMCEIRQVGYYDAFKLQRDNEDFNANLKRLELAGLWDEIVEMLKRCELPDDFECQMDWVKLGTHYRRLVEPLDIANYYRHFKNEDTGSYIVKGRPSRYKYTQRWLEHAWKMAACSSSDSIFWAKVEELYVCTANGRPFEEIRGRVLELEKEVLKWVAGGELGRDVFLESTTFVKWWKTLPQQHRLASCLARLMNGEGRNVPSLQ
eukprot:TRINITY_DN15885_c0_g2_i1.p1 TRINITY_DN15885_c0_g2~~TRINITY_DN15885_c0_g2_i1.p1  ORF type:complete len:622 (+),score=128.25 TRINITY_DN15885_c0_g2_i1:156-2021(+)